jgi:hypothetical protein
MKQLGYALRLLSQSNEQELRQEKRSRFSNAVIDGSFERYMKKIKQVPNGKKKKNCRPTSPCLLEKTSEK